MSKSLRTLDLIPEVARAMISLFPDGVRLGLLAEDGPPVSVEFSFAGGRLGVRSGDKGASVSLDTLGMLAGIAAP